MAAAAEDAPVPLEVPLLIDDQNDQQEQQAILLDHSLDKLESFLRLFGFCQSSCLSITLSWVAFAVLAVLAPAFVLLDYHTYCSHCEKYQITQFELEILVSQVVVAAFSLLCISHNLRKYGVRKLLFLDRHHAPIIQYIDRIRVFYCLVGSWLAICFILKTAHEVTRVVYLRHGSIWWSVVILFVSLLSWTYSTVVFLLGAGLFNLVGNLQVIHFENYGKLLERDLDVSLYIDEHIRLTYYLSKISHRFRIFLLLEFLVVTASQFMALLQTTGNQGIINFINAGDFAILSIVQLVGIVLCLNAAAKISHRAQGLGSVASRWHALVTCNTNDAPLAGTSPNAENLEGANQLGSFPVTYSGSDLESADYVPLPTNIQLTAHMSSYHKRQAFVNYVQSNAGGFTIFGWMVDRMLINTVFFIELSLVFFVLGKTVTITTR